MKKILVCSDLHCGHKIGLTPPAFYSPKKTELGKLQRELYSFFEKEVQGCGEFDAAFWLGDLIDGRGRRSGGVEQITTDMLEQCKIAESCIKTVKLKEKGKHFIVRGTPYHVGDEEDFENVIAEKFNAEISDHGWVDVNGVIFDLKHKVGGSGIPHGRHTAIAKEKVWNMLWAEKDYNPKANIFLRGHVHYFNYCGGDGWFGATMPALQGPGSKYGARQCSGTVDFGFLVFNINEKGGWSWESHLLKIRAGRITASKV